MNSTDAGITISSNPAERLHSKVQLFVAKSRLLVNHAMAPYMMSGFLKPLTRTQPEFTGGCDRETFNVRSLVGQKAKPIRLFTSSTIEWRDNPDDPGRMGMSPATSRFRQYHPNSPGIIPIPPA
jgi:hypothetical protein